jgi:hypothetical protein
VPGRLPNRRLDDTCAFFCLFVYASTSSQAPLHRWHCVPPCRLPPGRPMYVVEERSGARATRASHPPLTGLSRTLGRMREGRSVGTEWRAKIQTAPCGAVGSCRPRLVQDRVGNPGIRHSVLRLDVDVDGGGCRCAGLGAGRASVVKVPRCARSADGVCVCVR